MNKSHKLIVLISAWNFGLLLYLETLNLLDFHPEAMNKFYCHEELIEISLPDKLMKQTINEARKTRQIAIGFWDIMLKAIAI